MVFLLIFGAKVIIFSFRSKWRRLVSSRFWGNHKVWVFHKERSDLQGPPKGVFLSKNRVLTVGVKTRRRRFLSKKWVLTVGVKTRIRRFLSKKWVLTVGAKTRNLYLFVLFSSWNKPINGLAKLQTSASGLKIRNFNVSYTSSDKRAWTENKKLQCFSY